MRWQGFMIRLFRDIRYAQRHLRKNPGFTAFAVVILALGIGANTAVFSVVNAILFKPLPYQEPDRIVSLTSSWPKKGTHLPLVSLPDVVEWRAGSRAFASMAYYRRSQRPVALGTSATYAQVARVSPQFFRVFGVTPVTGRLFAESERWTAHTVVISHDFWQQRLGGGDVLNRTLRVDNRTLSVIGVLPPGFSYPAETAIWQIANVIDREAAEPRSSLSWNVVARLTEDASPEQAQAQLAVIAQGLSRRYPQSNEGRSVAVARLRDDMTGGVRLTLFILLGAVGIVLLIACANVATVLLAKSRTRTREVAIRTALGAGPGQIVRQLLTENLLLAMLAGCLGAAIGYVGSQALLLVAPPDIPRLAEVGMDRRVLAFTLAVSVFTTLVFGLAPAVQASRVDVQDTLKRGGARTGFSGGLGRLPRVLVITEIALSVVLLTVAGLLLRSLVALNSVELGFDPERVLTMDVSVPTKDAAAPQVYQELLASISSLPGVTAAGASLGVPGLVESAGSYWVDHLPTEAKVNPFDAVYSIVTPGALAALGIAVRRGRDFDARDTAQGPMTVLINEALAEKEFKGHDPIGRTMFAGFDSQAPMTIVGIVGNVRQWGPASPPTPEIFMPYAQHAGGAGGALRILVKTAGPPAAVESQVRAAVRQRSADIPMRFTTMERLLNESVAAPRFRTLLVTTFGLIALCLAIAGVYGVQAYTVGQRTGEIGLRMALGASARRVLWMVLRDGAILMIGGMVVGVLASMAVSRLLTSLLFEVKPYDPLAYLGGLAVLSVVTFIACYIPASRAAAVDPLNALRAE